MSTGPTSYFLLVYHLDTGKLHIEDFGGDSRAAAQAYTEREHQYGGDPTIEVVMVGADSLDTIRKTHSHYFATTAGDLVAELERELASALAERPAA